MKTGIYYSMLVLQKRFNAKLPPPPVTPLGQEHSSPSLDTGYFPQASFP